MKKALSFSFIILTALLLLFSITNSFAMKSKNFDVYEQRLQMMDDNFKILGEVTLKPGEEKLFETYTFKPVTIDFKTSITYNTYKKCKNDGIGIKKLSNLKYYLKDPMSAQMDVLPEDGVVKIAVKNFENFPITIKLYRLKFNA